MEILALGPIEVRNGGEEFPLGGQKPRTLLAALLLKQRRVVSRDRLLDLIWDDEPPPSGHALVHTYVSALRKVLAAAGEPDALVTRPPGYLLDIVSASSDIEQFNKLLGAARYAERRAAFSEAAETYEKALGLWRGPALTGVTAAFATSAAAQLAEEQLAASEGLSRCLLHEDRPDEVITKMSRITAEHPHREAAYGLLMRGLHATGRQADALAIYQDARRKLMDDLGVEPGQELRDQHREVLAGTAPRRNVTAAEVPASRQPRPAVARVPRLLPPDIGDFSSRTGALEQVLAVGRDSSEHIASPTVVISGFGGAGKSTLAVHAAHLLRDRFPDGQLFADFRGSEGGPSTKDVLARFTVALGTSGNEVPSDFDERAELYRMHVAGKRMVIVLDNVCSEAQVRDLVPGTEACLVIVTSRARLTGLDGAETIELELLDEKASLDMLRDIVGAERLAADPKSARTIARLCGGVPLAIRTAAMKLLARPHWPLRALAGRLGDANKRLDELSAGDRAVRASLEMTYTELDRECRRAFHLLAVLHLPDFAAWLAAPLLDVPLEDAEDIVERLVDLRLLDIACIDDIGRVRYRFHDLVQLFGAERGAEEAPECVTAATTRTLDLALDLVHASGWDRMYAPGGVPAREGNTARIDPRLTEEITNRAAEWFSAETPTLLQLIERTHEQGCHDKAVIATATMTSPFAVGNDFDSWQHTHTVTLRFAQLTGDLRAEAVTLAGLGHMFYEKDDFDSAIRRYSDAGSLAEQAGDVRTHALSLLGVGMVRWERAEYEASHTALRHADELAKDLDEPALTAAIQFGLGSVSRDCGDLDAATDAMRRSAQLRRAISDHRGVGQSVRGVSLCHRAAGDCDKAAEVSATALAIMRDSGGPRDVAYALQSLVKARIRQHRTEGARDLLADALDVCERHRDRFGTALITRTDGELALSTGDRHRARQRLASAHTMWQELGLDVWQARTLRDLAAAEALEDPQAAQRYWSRALATFVRQEAREAGELTASNPHDWYSFIVSGDQ